MSKRTPTHSEQLLEQVRDDMKFTRERYYKMDEKMDDLKTHISEAISDVHTKLDKRLTKIETKFNFYERAALAVWGGITTVGIVAYNYVKHLFSES